MRLPVPSVLVLVLLASTACTSDSKKHDPVPQHRAALGYMTVAAHGLRIDVPSDWRVENHDGCSDDLFNTVVVNNFGPGGDALPACGVGMPQGARTRVEFEPGVDGSYFPDTLPRQSISMSIGGHSAIRIEGAWGPDAAVMVVVPELKSSVLIMSYRLDLARDLATSVGAG